MASVCFATHATVSESHVSIIPETMSFSVAASVPIAFRIANHALYDAASHLAGKVNILIRFQDNASGRACIQLANGIGAQVSVLEVFHKQAPVYERLTAYQKAISSIQVTWASNRKSWRSLEAEASMS